MTSNRLNPAATISALTLVMFAAPASAQRTADEHIASALQRSRMSMPAPADKPTIAQRVNTVLDRGERDPDAFIAALLNEANAAAPISFTDTFQPVVRERANHQRRIGPMPRSLSKPAILDDAFSATPLALPALGVADVVDPLSVPLRVGRVVAVQISSQTAGRWTRLPDGGRLWTLAVNSPNTASLRLRIDAFNPPRGAELITWNATDPRESYGPITHERARPGLPYWTQTCFNSTVHLEYYLSPQVQGEHHMTITGALLGFKMDAATLNAGNNVAEGGLAGDGENCRIDVNCDNDWIPEARGVAHLAVVSGGSGYVCGGAMANRLPAFDSTPYFFTASHCVFDDETANSVDAFWLFQTDACDGTTPPLNAVPRTDGSVLLAMHSPSDYTLVGLTIDNIPDGLAWLGWTDEPPAMLAPAVEIHHPAGLRKSISYGMFEGPSGPGWTCAENIQIVNQFNLSNGGQENGSSGGPILTVSDHRIRGQAGCSEVPGFTCAPGEMTWAASFATAYPSLSHFLNAASTVWVDPGYAGTQTGTQVQPWTELLIGRYGVPGNGTIMLAAGTYAAQTIAGGGSKRYVIKANGGTVLFE